jgi:hypothetical protein
MFSNNILKILKNFLILGYYSRAHLIKITFAFPTWIPMDAMPQITQAIENILMDNLFIPG